MEMWIEKMNELFNAHPWTDNNRVEVKYIEKDSAIIVKVLSDMRVINIDNYSEYGLMMRIMEVMNDLYFDKKGE